MINENSKNDDYWMAKAFKLAEKAYTQNEVPVGAIITCHDRIIGQGYNQKERLNDPTAHAEIIAITAAANTLESWRLNNCKLYVTKEPCVMCAGAIVNSRISSVIFGAYDKNKGACGSLYDICSDKHLESSTSSRGGILEEQCSMILSEFFRKKRK